MPKNIKCHHGGGHQEKCSSSNVKCLIQVLEALVSDEECCERHEVEGCITLNQGNHEITVATESCPERVFLSVSPIGTPVCVGDIDLVGYALIPDGFILYANIRSSVAEVCYIVQG